MINIEFIFSLVYAIGFSILCITGLILGINLFKLINKISLFFNEKRENQIILNKKESNSTIDLSLSEKTEATIEILNFCNIIIENEILKNLSGYDRISKPYDMKKFDTDYKNIAETVYNAFKSDIIDNVNIIISSEFLMQHILDETMIRFMKFTEDYNNKLKNKN